MRVSSPEKKEGCPPAATAQTPPSAAPITSFSAYCRYGRTVRTWRQASKSDGLAALVSLNGRIDAGLITRFQGAGPMRFGRYPSGKLSRLVFSDVASVAYWAKALPSHLANLVAATAYSNSRLLATEMSRQCGRRIACSSATSVCCTTDLWLSDAMALWRNSSNPGAVLRLPWMSY